MGRFMSPDWAAQEEPVPYAQLDDPQSLNLYSYVLNNPLALVDPDGHAGSCMVDGNQASCSLVNSEMQDGTAMNNTQPHKYVAPQKKPKHPNKKQQPAGLPARGVASIYSDWFDGKTTASGETFSQDGYTAALLPKTRWHAVPMKTRAKITHDGKSVVVEINDRGAGARDGSMTRVLDITQAAARYLTGQEIWDDEDSRRFGLISITITQVPNTTPLGPVSTQEQQ
jgi:hypothetical protein